MGIGALQYNTSIYDKNYRHHIYIMNTLIGYIYIQKLYICSNDHIGDLYVIYIYKYNI